MAGHAQLKFVMTECSKTQVRLTRHIMFYCFLVEDVYHHVAGRTCFWCQKSSLKLKNLTHLYLASLAPWQTVQIQIRCRRMLHVIRVYTVYMQKFLFKNKLKLKKRHLTPLKLEMDLSSMQGWMTPLGIYRQH